MPFPCILTRNEGEIPAGEDGLGDEYELAGAAAYFIINGRFCRAFSPKTGVNWVNLAEMSGHILCHWRRQGTAPRGTTLTA